ncbi:MAG: S41 family peptidase [Bacteroidales bacterium]|nr:S41 family peptidase [Bacteroidales bacterium]
MRFYVIFFVGILFQLQLAAQSVYEQANKISKAVELINWYYVDSVDTENLVETAIESMLKELDPHSTYLNRDQVKKMSEPLEGNFEGIGVSFNILQDTILIINPIIGGPSEKLGILPGDRIVKVDGKNVAGIGITTENVFSLLRGEKGTRVSVTIFRKNEDELLDFTIIRDKIPIYSIDASYKVKDNIGYIKISRFAQTTIQEFDSAIIKLKKQGVQNLILDLTGNGGGLLEAAVQLADEFLENNKLIVYTEGLKSQREDRIATAEGNFEKGNVAIIIDEGSASASEIVAGAIQDWDRGVIIGRRSFGKGLVQRPLWLPDYSMLRLTVARYYTPSGRLIQKPYENGSEDYSMELINRYTNGEMMSTEGIHFPDSLKKQTLISKRTVYGGGGIMPDFFVAIDTSNYSDYYRDIVRKGLLNQFILTYLDDNRSNIENKYATFEDYKKNFTVDEKLFSKMVKFVEKEGLPKNDKDLAISEKQIKLLIKAYFARDLWGPSEFYEIVNESDTKFQKAIAILEDWENLAEFIIP